MKELARQASKRSLRKGQATIELVAAMICFITLLLGLVDLISIVLQTAQNEKIARNVARVAATQSDDVAALYAANQAAKAANGATNTSHVRVTNFVFDMQDSGRVTLATSMAAVLPVPLGGWNELTIVSFATAAISTDCRRK